MHAGGRGFESRRLHQAQTVAAQRFRPDPLRTLCVCLRPFCYSLLFSVAGLCPRSRSARASTACRASRSGWTQYPSRGPGAPVSPFTLNDRDGHAGVGYSASNPWLSNVNVRQFSVTVRTTVSDAPPEIVASISRDGRNQQHGPVAICVYHRLRSGASAGPLRKRPRWLCTKRGTSQPGPCGRGE